MDGQQLGERGARQAPLGRRAGKKKVQGRALPSKIQGSKIMWVLSHMLHCPPPAHGNGRLQWETTLTNIQRLGECLGKGAFGAVYKAFNWGTGEAVAVKQVKLTDLPKSELRMIEVGLGLVQATAS